MKVAIVVHSHTGNTLSVAERLKQKFVKAGHSVTLEKVSAVCDSEADPGKVQLSAEPDISKCDMLILGAPVRGFSLSPVMQAYLNGVGSLRNKKTACFVTQMFPFAWMGGKRALGQLCKICQGKEAVICGTGVVNWSRANTRERQIATMVEKL